jgi:hypothetical protein
VRNLDQTVSKLARSDIEVRARFEIPHGPGAELRGAGPQRVAVYEVVRPDVANRLNGRRDF